MDSVKQKSAWNEDIFKTTNLVDFADGVYEMAASFTSDGSVGSVVVIYHFHHWFEHVSVETVPTLYVSWIVFIFHWDLIHFRTTVTCLRVKNV